MTEDLKGKRLMLLGGGIQSCEIIREAHKLGIEVYETDYLEDSPAKKHADKSFMTSCIDVDAVVELCKNEDIDGVFTGYTDSLLPYTEEICRKLDMPFWGSAENIDICIDKMKFKEACNRAGVKTIPYQKIKQDELDEKLEGVECPVVIKPVDNSGSRGVFKCYDKQLLKEYCEKALTFSKKKEILIEKLMDVNKEFSAYYLLSGGGILSSMGDRYVVEVDKNTAPQAVGMFFPSIYTDRFLEKADSSIREFFRQNNMRDGFVFIQGFADNDEFYINEIGYRLNGGYTYKFTEFYNGYNQVQELLKFSLMGRMDTDKVRKTNPHFSGYGLLLTISLKEGEIAEIRGIEEIRKHTNVIDFVQQHFEGDKLQSHGTSAQIFGYAFCVSKDKNELKDTVDFVRKNLSVKDINNNDMLIGVLDVDTIKMKTE